MSYGFDQIDILSLMDVDVWSYFENLWLEKKDIKKMSSNFKIWWTIHNG